MINSSDIYLLAVISELEPATYAEISMRSQAAQHFLGQKLDDLINRGFIHLWNGRYTLAKGVKESLLAG